MTRVTRAIFLALSFQATATGVSSAAPHPFTKLLASDASPADYFGNAVAVSGTHAVVGAWLDDDAGPSSGSAYVLLRDDAGTPTDPTDDVWQEQFKLVPNDAHVGDQFGYSVAIDGDIIVVGAWKSSGTEFSFGSAYVFRRDDHRTPDPSDDSWLQTAKLTPNVRRSGDNFGASVAVSGEHVVVGSVSHRNGSAYVFVQDDNGTPEWLFDDVWLEQANLTPNTTAQYHDFGDAVAIDGNHVLVGVHKYAIGPGWVGAAYVFQRMNNATPGDPLDDTWREQSFLTPSDTPEGGQFGRSVAIHGDWAIIGAPGHSPAEYQRPGSAYIFRRNANGTQDPIDDTWVEHAKIGGPGLHLGDSFGFSVGISSQYAVVGANFASLPQTSRCGLAYVFARSDDSWQEQATLTASPVSFGDGFGRTVAVDGSSLVVGAWADDAAGLGAGAAYGFELSGSAGNVASSPQVINAMGSVSGSVQCVERQLVGDGSEGELFGSSVATSGDFIVVGAEGADGLSTDEGAAYIFKSAGSEWVQDARLTASGAGQAEYFGSSVAVDGGTAMVATRPGGRTISPPNGKVYIYRNDGTAWTEETVLSDTLSDTGFGNALALSDGIAVVGAAHDDVVCLEWGWDDPWCNSGAVHVYRYDGQAWGHEQKLTGTAAGPRGLFGWSVAVDGAQLIAGSPFEGPGPAAKGFAYIFVNEDSTWELEAKLSAADARPSDEFGYSVAIDGDRAVVGAWAHDHAGPASGAAYIFKRDGAAWIQEAKLTPMGATTGDGFGYSVAMSGDYVLVGAYADAAKACDGGAVYLFARNGVTWSQQARLVDSDATPFGWLGRSAAISDSTVLVGAPTGPGAQSRSGSASVFTAFQGCYGTSTFDECMAPPGDVVVFAYEGDSLPFDEGSGWFGRPCDGACSESVEDGHLALRWPTPMGDAGSGGYHHRFANGPGQAPPNLWFEWRFRSNHPLGSCFTGCDATVSIYVKAIRDIIEHYGDYAGSWSGVGYILGLNISEFHTFRFETSDGVKYRVSADGVVFKDGVGNATIGYDYFQIHPRGGCSNNGCQIVDKINEWDFVRYGTIAYGERVIATEPPVGFVDPRQYWEPTSFVVTFDSPNYVYVDDVHVQSSGGTTPNVIWTRRRDNDTPNNVEIVLDGPLPMGETTRFTIDDGAIANVVEYTLVSGDTDGDGDRDLYDFANLQQCFGRTPDTGACHALDMVKNWQINVDDVAAFIKFLAGPGSVP